MSVVRWENPPRADAYRVKYDWAAIGDVLQKKPGKWAVVAVYETVARAAVQANAIRAGSVAAMRPAGTFDAMARTVDGECRVYARYVGGGGDQ